MDLRCSRAEKEIERAGQALSLFFSVKVGAYEDAVLTSCGDSNRFISFYAQGRSDNYLLSSAGLNINIGDFRFSASIGLDNTSIGASIVDGNVINSVSLKADITQFKIGFETSNTVIHTPYFSTTSYTNVSVTGGGILAIYNFLNTGQWNSSYRFA